MNIILLDNQYPFPGGEPFLKNEIVSGIYEQDRLYIVPISQRINLKETVSVPRMAELVPAYPGSITVSAVAYSVFSTFLRKETWAELCSLIRGKRFNLRRAKDLLKFMLLSNMKYFSIEKQLRNVILREPDVLVYTYWMHQHAYIAARLKEKYPDISFVCRCHGFDLYEKRAPSNYLPMRSYIFQHVDRIFPISKNGVSYLQCRYGDEVSGKIFLSYLGTYDQGLSFASKDGILRIVSCSNLVPVKRVHLLIQALSLIQDTAIQWTHYGDGELRQDLEALAARSLPDHIRWRFAGNLNNEDLMKQYSQMPVDLFINVSESEGLPVSIMEAMSFGIPVAATDVGGTPEIVESEKNGFLLKQDFKPEELTSLICRFASEDIEYRNRLRKNARSTWERSFSAEKNFRQFYEELAGLSRMRAPEKNQ